MPLLQSIRKVLHSWGWYLRLRQLQRVGLLRSFRWSCQERQVLRSAPIITSAFGMKQSGSEQAECELHLLTWNRDWRMALWAAKSFYRFSGVNWPLAFHDGGGLSSVIQSELRHHFPHARIFTADESNRIVEKSLADAGLEHLARARQRFVLVRKITDFVLLATAPKFLMMDSDVLFLAPPDELVRIATSDLNQIVFSRDYQDAYSIDSSQARQWFGLDLPERVNTGLGIVPIRCVDLGFLNEMFAPDRIPLGKDLWAEQTAWAIQAARAGLQYLPAGYVTQMGPLNLSRPGVVSRHYVSSVRDLYFDEGLAFLLQPSNHVLS